MLPLETESVARDNNTILILKPGDQTLSRLTQLIIVVALRSPRICHEPKARENGQPLLKFTTLNKVTLPCLTTLAFSFCFRLSTLVGSKTHNF